jgi:hypothetical protein
MRDSAWLVSQEFPYLPARDRKKHLFRYGSPAVFEALIKAGVVYKNDRHPDNASLEQVILPEGAQLVKHPSDPKCALLLGSDNKQIAHVYFYDRLQRWILHTPQSGSSPINNEGHDIQEVLDDIADSIVEFGETIAETVQDIADGIGDFFRRLD